MKGFLYHETDISKVIEGNLIAFFDWNFIDKGALHNITIPKSGAYGGDFSRLRLSPDPRYTSGRVWESIRGNWVWESGLSTLSPIRISGVFVNNNFQSSGYKIDYINGRVIFDTAIATSSTVKLEYSYKEVQFISADDNPWLRQVQYRSRRVDDSNFLLGSGGYIGLPENRLQLPSVGVSVVSRTNKGFQLGGHHKVIHTAKFHVLAEDEYTCKKISDTIANQENTTFYVFDPNRMARSGAFPLNIDGTLSSNPLIYPNLVKYSGNGGYRYTDAIQNGKCFMFDCEAQKGQWIGNAYYTTVTVHTETIVTKM